MALYWYISQAKLETLAPERPGLARRLTGLKLGVAPVTAEVAVQAQAEPGTVSRLERTLAMLRKNGSIRPMRDLRLRAPGTLYEFEGVGVRLVEAGVAWIAAAEDDVALLLVGSPRHTVGASSEPTATSNISPSADPIGTISRVLSTGRIDVEDSDVLSYVWAMAMRSSTRFMPPADLPSIRGVFVYAGRQIAIDYRVARSGISDIKSIVVGSPLYIEQLLRQP